MNKRKRLAELENLNPDRMTTDELYEWCVLSGIGEEKKSEAWKVWVIVVCLLIVPALVEVMK